MCPNMNIGIPVGMMTILPVVIFGGFVVNTSTLPASIAWIQWLSPVRYGFQCLTMAEFDPRERADLYTDFLGFD